MKETLLCSEHYSPFLGAHPGLSRSLTAPLVPGPKSQSTLILGALTITAIQLDSPKFVQQLASGETLLKSPFYLESQ